MKNQDFFPAKIIEITQVTKKIKSFRLDYANHTYTFKPGQWIDLYISDEKEMGGYTITSSIFNSGYIDLAIRESISHPVTQSLHNQTKVGDIVMITQGQGKFFLTPDLMNSPLTLIAGGIGVTPLLSMLRSANNKKLKLFYSVSSDEDILFKEELAPYSIFTVTKNPSINWAGEHSRINLALLKKYSTNFDSNFFICGPRPMIDAITKELIDYGVPKDHIHFEKWW